MSADREAADLRLDSQRARNDPRGVGQISADLPAETGGQSKLFRRKIPPNYFFLGV